MFVGRGACVEIQVVALCYQSCLDSESIFGVQVSGREARFSRIIIIIAFWGDRGWRMTNGFIFASGGDSRWYSNDSQHIYSDVFFFSFFSSPPPRFPSVDTIFNRQPGSLTSTL